ncbi:hypothetical protein [Dyella nitratireducens]|uniref:Uncharacterized protein n=1 Tax=Dyella nitratireducens TaxID=1849580 RepID=A0ABQ1GC88_9GAMM|nr:hypothetical protein [Dyella nitratireducens]GGA40864.1 hypothetical protein GCM10010981_32610 [Dyella nitratireducens]GLQ40619.1 hypothetical protein GCM10007902_04680 [Dyella nitratireducens]
MRNIVLAAAITCAISGCSSSDDAPQAQPTYSGAPTVKALPFSVETAYESGLYQGNLKVANIGVGVNGGSTKEWTATAIAIAQKIGGDGIDSVEVSVRRNDIHEKQGVRFREVAHAYYSPNTQRDIWSRGKPWQILQAEPSALSTQQDVDLYEEYDALENSYEKKGMDPDAADNKAGAVLEKKYHLPANWSLPSGNDMNPEVPRDSMNVDDSAAASNIAALNTCLRADSGPNLVHCDSGSTDTTQ